jgi:hypothetical protein
MKLTHRFAEMTPDKRPQDPHMDGTGLRFETMEHGGDYPDTMPQAIKLIDAEGRSCIYVPIMQNGKVVDSQRFVLDTEDEMMRGMPRGVVIGKVDGDPPLSEAEHFWKCEACGGWFDMRDLGAVLEHEEPLPHPACDQGQ